jgi:hypothetical protein
MMSLSELLKAYNSYDENIKDLHGVMTLREEKGKFLLDGEELPSDHPEEWGPMIIAAMAKNYLK